MGLPENLDRSAHKFGLSVSIVDQEYVAAAVMTS